ncbi:hypothetical protein ACQE32_04875 [Pantoea sp. FN0302]|uniref:hypothetical protein n=1 Tax=unclassified Pantoea TaxID=2630326 RepID=UPI003CF4C86F
MALPGFAKSTLPDYSFTRLTHKGISDFDFAALGAAMDCTRDFSLAGIIYAEGEQRYLVRPGKRHPNGQSGIITHVIVTKMPEKSTTHSVGKSLTAAVSSSSFYINGTIQSLAVL